MPKLILIMILMLACRTALAQSAEPSDSLVNELKEIVVTANPSITRLQGTTLVSTIAGSPLADIGNALDALQQLPMIKTDDESVTVVGRGTPLVYIDGRPANDIAELRTLRSRDIKKVELILAPGAEYDASTGAVLKITTRRDFIRGLSLDNEANTKFARKTSAHDYLNLRYFLPDGWEIFAQSIFTHFTFKQHGNTVNSLEYEGKPTVVGSAQSIRMLANNYGAKLGFSHTRGDRSFGAYYRMLHEHGHFGNPGTEWIDDTAPIVRDISRHITGLNHYSQAYYDDTFAGKYNLHIDATAIVKNSTARQLTAYPDGAAPDVPSLQKSHSCMVGGKLTLAFPLGNGRLVAGTEDSYTATRLDYRMLGSSIDYIPSSLSSTRQTSAAAFGSWSAQLGHWDLTAGLQYEFKDFTYSLDGVKDHGLSRTDNFLTPDISLGYTFDENSSVTLSYKSFTEQPSYSQLTGGLNYVGLHEIEGGNPALRDGHSHQVQLMGMWRDFILQATFRRSLDTYGFVKQVYPAPTLQLVFHPVNIDVSAAWAYLVWQHTVRRWTPAITVGCNPQWLKLDGQRYNKPIWSYYFDNTLTLPGGWLVTANIYGNSSGYVQTQLFNSQWFVMDVSVKKTFFGKTLGIKLSANDIFNTTANGWRLQSYGIDMKKSQSYDDRHVSLTVTYTVQPRKSAYSGTGAAESEASRL